MSDEMKYMSIKDFRDLGFLQEANRLFFHPLGLALEVQEDEQGSLQLSGIQDFRHDPEGIVYSCVEDQESADKALYVDNLKRSKIRARNILLGTTDGVQKILLERKSR